MADIPFLILILFVIFTITIPIIGYIYRSRFPPSALLFILGAMWLLLFITTDNIEALALDTVEIPIYNQTYIMNVTSGTASTALQTANQGVAEYIVNTNSMLYDKKISCITADLSKTGSPTGLVTFGVANNNLVIKKTFGTIDSSIIFTSQRTYTICLQNHDYYITQLNDRIGVFYSAGSVGNGINVFADVNDVYDGTNSIRSTLAINTWTDVTTSDSRFIITGEELTLQENQELYNIKNPDTLEPSFIGIMLITMSLIFMMVGVVVEKD